MIEANKVRWDRIRTVSDARRAVRRSAYGKKDGEGPTRGRKASVYMGLSPEGVEFTVRSFKVHNSLPGAVVMAFFFGHDGVWVENGVYRLDDLPDWVRQRYLNSHNGFKLVPATCKKLGGTGSDIFKKKDF